MLGDTVQFPLTLHRLDKDRLIAGYDFIREAVVRSLGATHGRGWGSASYIEYDTTDFTGTETSGSIGVGYGVLVTSTHDVLGTPPAGRAILHDPARESQVGHSSVAVTTATKWIQFRRQEDSTADEITQTHWNAGNPVQVASATSVREYVEFRSTTADAPNSSITDGWFPLARVTWAGNIPTVETIHFLDGPVCTHAGDVTFGALGAVDGAPNATAGILADLRRLFAQVYMLIDSDYDFAVTGSVSTTGEAVSVPQAVPKGLRQLATGLEEATKFKDMLNVSTSLTTQVRTAALLRVTATGSYSGTLWAGAHTDVDVIEGISIATAGDLDTHAPGLKASMGANGCLAIRFAHSTASPIIDHVLLQNIGTESQVAVWSYVGQVRFDPGDLGVGTDGETWVALCCRNLDATLYNGTCFVEAKTLSDWWTV